MTCESWRKAMALDAGGNLPPAEADALRRHLRGCAACRRFAEEMAASQRALRRFAGRPLDEASLARVRRRVLAGIADGGASRLRHFSGRPRNAVRWLALAAGLVAALVVWRWPARVDEKGHDVARLPDLRPSQARPAAPPVSASPAAAPPLPAPPSDEPRRETEAAETRAREEGAGAAPRRREASRPGQRLTVMLTSSTAPLESTPTQVVLPVPSGSLSPQLLAEEHSGSPLARGSAILLDLPAPAPSGPVLRQLAESSDYTIYWLEEPADTLKEKEDADTNVL